MPLNKMAEIEKDKSVSHEAFGEKVLSMCVDIRGVLEDVGIKPEDIISISLGEKPSRWIFTQLIHSTLDADRIDYLMRDAHHAGISYGHLDLNFLLSNLRYDKEEDLFAVDYKGITTFEHYLLARYYMYLNMTFHKKVMAYELIAKTLYYEMTCQGHVIGRFDKLVEALQSAGDAWIRDFDDNYFWRKLKEWNPEGRNKNFDTSLRDFLLEKKRPITVFEERCLVPQLDRANDKFAVLRREIMDDSKEFDRLCEKYGVDKNCLALLENKVEFEEQPPLTSHRKSTTVEVQRKLGRVYEGYEFKDLIDVKYSVIRELSRYAQHIRRLFYYDLYEKSPNIEEFGKALLGLFR